MFLLLLDYGWGIGLLLFVFGYLDWNLFNTLLASLQTNTPAIIPNPSMRISL